MSPAPARRPTTAHSDSLSVSSHPRPSTSHHPAQYGQQQQQQQQQYHQQNPEYAQNDPYAQYAIEEEYEDEEEDEDVFAFLPGQPQPAQVQLSSSSPHQQGQGQSQGQGQLAAARPTTSQAGGATNVAYPSATFDPYARFPAESFVPLPAYPKQPSVPLDHLPSLHSLPQAPHHDNRLPLPHPPLQPPPQTPPSTGTASHAPESIIHGQGQDDAYRLRRLNTAATTAVSSNNHNNMTGSPTQLVPPGGGFSSGAGSLAGTSGKRPASSRSREVVVNFPGRDRNPVARNEGKGASNEWEGAHSTGYSAFSADGGYDDSMIVEAMSGRGKGVGSITETMSLTPSMLDDETTTREGSIKMEFDLDAIEEDEDSPYPEVRASVSNIDDPDMPALTIRMWVIGMLSCIAAGAINVFLNFRSTSPSIVPLTLLLISYPMGKFLAFILPITTYRFSLPSLPSSILSSSFCSSLPLPLLRLIRPLTYPRAIEFSFNPGPWNIKEHALVYIMANVATSAPYAINAIATSQVYYKLNVNYWFSLVLVLATQLTGFGLAGLCRRFLVWPASMVWPQNLVACALLNTLHAEDEDDYQEDGQGQQKIGWMKRPLTRYRFFMILTFASFAFFFLPGFLFQALSVFSFICWAVPNNIPVNQLFGVHTGLGMSFLTFDWTLISWIGSPLMVPWWAQLQVFLGFVFFFWILTPVLYYTNSWSLSYFPISANSPYDRLGKVYNITRVLTPDIRIDLAAYEAYSPLYLPATYAMTYLIAFTLSTCVIVHTALYHSHTLLKGIKRMRVEADDIHAKLMRSYPEVPDWWYLSVFAVFFALAIVAVEVWKTTVPVWALLLSVALPTIYVLPSGFIYAMTGQGISLNLLAQIIPGTLLPGKPLANMIFKAYSVQTLNEATQFVQDLKLGHYIKIAPRATFQVQLVATILTAFVQVGVKDWLFARVKDICSPHQASFLTCPHSQVFFTASAIWGLIGPSRQFGSGTIYHPHLYAIIVGAILPLPFWLYQRRYPNSWVRWVSTPVILNGVSSIPPATGINYSSWFLVGFVFQYLIRKRNFAWWRKFNYITSAALDSGTAISVVFIFLALQLKGPLQVKWTGNWWGNDVFMKTADFTHQALKKVPSGGIPGRT